MSEKTENWLSYANKLITLGYRLFDSAFTESHRPMTAKGSADPVILTLLLLLRSLSNFKGALLLSRANMLVETRVLVRCCIENSFSIGGLVNDGDEFVKELSRDEIKSQEKKLKTALRNIEADSELAERLRAHIEHMATRYPKGNLLNPKSASERSPLGELYLAYSVISADAAHPSFSSLQRHLTRSTEDGEIIRGIDASPVADENQMLQTLHWGCSALLGAIVGTNQILQGTCLNNEINMAVNEIEILAQTNSGQKGEGVGL